jgi:short-subunit dehydrogenase
MQRLRDNAFGHAPAKQGNHLMSQNKTSTLAESYGPWAIIAGASEGTGRAFAHQIAAAGIPCILIARREEPLRLLAEEIRAKNSVECVVAAIDLSRPDALENIKAAVGAREIGLLVANSGADPHGAHFLQRDIETWIDLVNRNVINIMRCCHHFGGLMRERRRGGILLVGSGACYGGGSYMATYSASKAFDLCFAESLWAELNAFNVDVLYLVLSITNTPALQKLLEEKGKRPPPGMASPEKVAQTGLANLANGPVFNWGQKFGLRAGWRRIRLKIIDFFSKKTVFGDAPTH